MGANRLHLFNSSKNCFASRVDSMQLFMYRGFTHIRGREGGSHLFCVFNAPYTLHTCGSWFCPYVLPAGYDACSCTRIFLGAGLLVVVVMTRRCLYIPVARAFCMPVLASKTFHPPEEYEYKTRMSTRNLE